MYVLCKKCGSRIEVANRPSGFTQTSNVKMKGNVNVEGGKISFGRGGSISFGPGGSLSFGGPVPSEFTCMECGHTDVYNPEEILK